MSFIDCTEEEARIFVDYLKASGFWISEPPKQWEAYRLKKHKDTGLDPPYGAPIEHIIVYRNKKGTYSFPPLAMALFVEAQKQAVRKSVHDALEICVGKPVDKELVMEHVERLLKSPGFTEVFKEIIPGFSGTTIQEVQRQGDEFVVKFSVPVNFIKLDLGDF